MRGPPDELAICVVVRVASYERSVRQRDGYDEVLYIFPAPEGEQPRSSIVALLDQLERNGAGPATDVNGERRT